MLEDDAPPTQPQSPRSWISRLVDTSKSTVELATSQSLSMLRGRQLDKELQHHWVRLGKQTLELVRNGDVEHPTLVRLSERLEELIQSSQTETP